MTNTPTPPSLMDRLTEAAAADTIARLGAENEEARKYLGRLLIHYHPACVPLDDLPGVCTQIDNAMTEIKTLRAASAREAKLREALVTSRVLSGAPSYDQ